MARSSSLNPEPARLDRLAQLKPSEIREIHNFSEELRRKHPEREFIRLHFGEPDQGTPEFIIEAAAKAMREGALYYESNAGRWDLRQALAGHYAQHYQAKLTPEHFLAVSGGVLAINLAMMGLLAPGDEMINVTPAWPNFRGAAEMAGASVIDFPLTYDAPAKRFKLDFAGLERLATNRKRLRLICVATPANPTGWVADTETKERLLNFCRANQLWLMADEMYDRIVFEGSLSEGGGRPSFAELRRAGDQLIVINGFSKAYCMTGWRLGYLIAEPSLVTQLAQMNEWVTSCAPSMVQVAAIAALKEGEPFIAESLARYKRLRELTLKKLEAIPGAIVARPSGSFYCFVSVPGSADSVKFCRQLVEAEGVIVAPGAAFGGGGEGWLRICFAQAGDRLEEALDKLAHFVSAQGAAAPAAPSAAKPRAPRPGGKPVVAKPPKGHHADEATEEGSEQRTTKRVPFNHPVRIVAPVPTVGQGIDIGAGGIGVALPIELERGKMVEILILDGAATAYGTVRWVRQDGDQYRTGIQFREEDWAIMQLIESLHGQEG